MKNRILLAFILSSLVLIFWQMMFPSPQQSPVTASGKPTSKELQIIENKEVTTKQQGLNAIQTSAKTSQKSTISPETTAVIQNELVSITMSSRGGSLKEADILAFNEILPVRGIFELSDLPELSYTIERNTAQEIVFVARNNGIEIRKIYKISDGEYVVNADMQITNITKGPIAISPDIQTMLIDMNMAGEEVEKGRDRNLMEYSVLSEGKIERKTGAYKFEEKESKKKHVPAEWFGFRNRYFCTIFKPNFSVQGYEFSPIDKKQLSSKALLSDITLDGGESANFTSTIYFGPQNDDILKSYGMNFEKIHVYFRAKFFDSIAKIIEDLIKFVHKVTKNWGVSIILVSLLIYLSFFPLTMKSMISMRKMQSLQPKILELREKHESNPQKLNQEIMKLYAENKVNPLGGCLPLLLQMPIFICLYQMIWRSVLFKGADFLWIKDLSSPDRLIVLDKTFPIIGNEINVLPLAILVLMFVQQKMTAKNMNATDPNQIAQQKMMTFMMPAVLFFVFYHIASGLTLYFTVFYIVSCFTQWYIGKRERAVS